MTYVASEEKLAKLSYEMLGEHVPKVILGLNDLMEMSGDDEKCDSLMEHATENGYNF